MPSMSTLFTMILHTYFAKANDIARPKPIWRQAPVTGLSLFFKPDSLCLPVQFISFVKLFCRVIPIQKFLWLFFHEHPNQRGDIVPRFRRVKPDFA
jgi:hypothetical protein